MTYTVGVDVGGTKIEAVLADEQGRVLQRTRIPTQAQEGAGAVLERIESAAKAVMTHKVRGVGIALPGTINRDVLLECPNIPSLEGKNVLKMLQKRFGVPVIVENDANCFALAEHRWGAGKGKGDVVGLIIGTGVGAGIIIDGKLYNGARGGAGEYGQIPYGKSTVEDYAAGPGILRRYQEKGGKLQDVRDVFKSKEGAAKETLSEAYNAMGWLLATISRSVDPHIIILGGGVSDEPLLAPLRRLLKEAGCTTPVAKNRLGSSSGVLGAASLALH